MSPHHRDNLPDPSQNPATDAFLGPDFSPLDAVLSELTRLDREIVVMRSRIQVFAKAIDRQENEVQALRNYISQSEIFAVVSDTTSPSAPTEL